MSCCREFSLLTATPAIGRVTPYFCLIHFLQLHAQTYSAEGSSRFWPLSAAELDPMWLLLIELDLFSYLLPSHLHLYQLPSVSSLRYSPFNIELLAVDQSRCRGVTMFEFVNATSDTMGQDDEIKRKVRSHAMKDYRARQRNNYRTKAVGDSSTCGTTKKPSRLTFRFVIDSRDGSKDQDEEAINMERATTLSSISPSTWGNETPDIFSSPAQLQQMFGLCRECTAIHSEFDGRSLTHAKGSNG